MKRVLQSQSFFVVLSVLYVITGIVILFWPNLTMPLMGTAFAIGMLVVGFTRIIIYFTKDHLDSILTMDLTMGVIFASFGAFMLMHSDFVEILIPFSVAIFLLMGALVKIQYALDMRHIRARFWWLMLVFVVILFTASLVLLYNPFAGDVLLYFIGGALILEGALNIFSILFVSHRMKQISRGKYPGGPMGSGPHGPGIPERVPRRSPRNMPEAAPQGNEPHEQGGRTPAFEVDPPLEGDGAIELYRDNQKEN